jgi:hypothetical protein
LRRLLRASLVVGLLALAVAPATAAAANRIKAGSYQGVADGIEVRFDLGYDGGKARIENFEMVRHSCGRRCPLMRMLTADVNSRKASFVGTSEDVPLSQVELDWRANGHEVDGTWTVLTTLGGPVINATPRRLEASFQFDGSPSDPNDPGPGDPGAQGGAAGGGAGAIAAATRSEYVGQLDPVCKGYEQPAVKLLNKFFKETRGVLKAQATSDASRIERRLLGPFARLLGGADKLTGRLTTQIAGVPPPAGDEAAVAAWLDSRRAYNTLAARAAHAAKRRNSEKLFKLLGEAATRVTAGEKLVAGFGFQSCVG